MPLQRRTDRLPFDHPTFWSWFEPVLRSVGDDIAMLDVLSGEVRPQLAEGSVLAKTLRRFHASDRTELQRWTSTLAPAVGMPPEALGSATAGWRVDVRRWC
jgi:hypothetical protein